ncbi:MAG: stage III sporulation protein AG [Paenibacillaceae bacterium ZCTH02-B3]|nr:MAG: stage III sporulation protein AG [Paenibacillaceae bacterium ZCTH02-B3]
MSRWLKRLEEWAGLASTGQSRLRAFRLLVLLGAIGAALLIASSLMDVKKVDPSEMERTPPPRDRDAPGETEETFLGGSFDESRDSFTRLERELELKIKDILEKIVGVGAVDVFVTMDSTEEIVVEKNESYSQRLTDESDKNGASRHVTETNRDGQVALYESSGSQSPIIIKRIKPRVRGVLIAAKGAENATVKRLIAEAVSRGLDVPLHRISVVPRKQ